MSYDYSYRKNGWGFQETSFLLQAFLEAASKAKSESNTYFIGTELLTLFNSICRYNHFSVGNERTAKSIRHKFRQLCEMDEKFNSDFSGVSLTKETEEYKRFFKDNDVSAKLKFIKVSPSSSFLFYTHSVFYLLQAISTNEKEEYK